MSLIAVLLHAQRYGARHGGADCANAAASLSYRIESAQEPVHTIFYRVARKEGRKASSVTTPEELLRGCGSKKYLLMIPFGARVAVCFGTSELKWVRGSRLGNQTATKNYRGKYGKTRAQWDNIGMVAGPYFAHGTRDGG